MMGAEISPLHPSKPQSWQRLEEVRPWARGFGQQKQQSPGGVSTTQHPVITFSYFPGPASHHTALHLFQQRVKSCGRLWIFFLWRARREQAEAERRVKTNLESYGSHSNAWRLCSRRRAGTQSWIYAVITESGLQEESHAKL